MDHYLDDFVILGPWVTRKCAEALDTVLRACADLGVPLALEKLEGPTSCLTFLGIEMDMDAGTLRLPREKLDRLHLMLQQWVGRKACKRRELESLVGTLQHVCKVIHPGRSFLRRMIDLLRIPRRPYHHIWLNREFQADLQWWRTFAAHWNGVAVLPPSQAPVFEMTSDASGHWGCGAWSGQS